MKSLFAAFLVLAQFGAFAQTSMNIDSLFNWQDPSLPASSAHSNTYNEVWGYAKNAREYAIIGTTLGTHIFDVTVPAASEEIAFIEGELTGPQVVHRDYHDYDEYLYIVCDEGASTLQIVDLRQLPDTAMVVYDSPILFPRSHNIFIDSSSARMYMCGGTMEFAVYSLADPASPTLLLDCPADVPFWSSIGYIHDVFVRGDTAYLNAGQNGLFVVDFRNIDTPQMIGSLDLYVQSGYNHSGWLMDNEPFYALADETHGMDVKIIDVSDVSDLQVTDTIGSNVHEFSIPHNLIYRDGLLFVSHYFDGLYMYDCEDPAHPILAGYYDTSTEPQQDGWYRGCWGVYPFLPSGNILASDMQTGLWVFSTDLLLSTPNLQVEKQAFTVFPNPTSSYLNFNPEFIGYSYRIVDSSGRTVMDNNKLRRNTLDVKHLATGLYTLVLHDEGQLSHTQFVKR